MKKTFLNSAIGAALLLSSCTTRTVDIFGFAYKNDKIIIRQDHRPTLYPQLNETPDVYGVYYFTEKMGLPSGKENIPVNVTIDSAGYKVLDTSFVIPGNYKKPFVSVLHPSPAYGGKRELFIADYTEFPIE